MWAKTFPVKYAVPLKEAAQNQFYLWFSPTQALEHLGSVELTAVHPNVPTVTATFVTLKPVKTSYYSDLFFVGIGEKWVCHDETISVVNIQTNPSKTTTRTNNVLKKLAGQEGELAAATRKILSET